MIDYLRKSNLFWLKIQKETFVRKKLQTTSVTEEIPANVDFRILWWYLKKNYRHLFLTQKTKRLPILDNKILKFNKWKNKYYIQLEILDKYENNKKYTEIIPIKYKWWNCIKVKNNKWKYTDCISISNKNQYKLNHWKTYKGDTRWFLELKTKKWDIILFLDLTAKRENYHKRIK